MEPFPKRQRLYAPMDRSFPQSFDDQHAYYDELGDDFLEDEADYDEEEEEPEPGYDPEAELGQKRARLDYKLKSTFESIFEKYERDFDGVGDEIDLETGEIVVNNGHIVQMLDEQDAGDTSRARQALREYTQEPDELPSSSFDDTEILEDQEEEEDEDEVMSDEDIVEDDMAEDDMILRGFAKANRFQQGSPELGISNAPIAAERVRRQEPKARSALLPRPVQAKPLPSRADILAQFGPQLGPQIVEYVSQQHVAEERLVEPWRAPEPRRTASRNIESAWRVPALPSAAPRRVEPAWRVPELPSAAPVRRPILEPVVLLPEEERSPSPEASASIWAPARTRGPRRLDRADNSALFRGESRAPNSGPRSMLDPLGYRPTRNAAQPGQLSSPKRKRLAFTAEEDDMLLSWVSKLRRHGHALRQSRWREFAAEHPQHSAASWQQRYTRTFTYLSTNQVEESDISNSEVSVENLGYHPPAIKRTEPQYDSDQAPRERPARIRKPAQTDPRILSWNQAVDSIESVDPILHAGIMEDARRANNEPQHSSFRRLENQNLEDSDMETLNQSQDNTPPTEVRRSYDNLPIRSSLAVQPTPEQEDFLIPGAPCPHADCKLQPAILYKLQRREHEDLSEMCLHLFQAHHTTPFPCGEIGCSKKGEDGYFMQLDLVKHVRLAHKSISALQRLRGRVDSALLEQQVAIARPATTSDPMQRPISQHRDSDFMSPQKGYARNRSSSQPSGFDPDRTLTPRGMAGASAFTPMTSVSSLQVNHPSATSTSMAVRDMSNSQDRTISDSQVDSSQIASSQPRIEPEPIMHSRESFQQAPRMPPNGEPSSSADFSGIQIPPTPQTSAGDSVRAPALGQPNPAVEAEEQNLEPQDTVHASIELRPQVLLASVPKPFVPQNIVEAESSTAPEPSTTMALPQKTRTVQPMTRNIVDPTYEFSDEEPEVRPPLAVFTQEVSTPRQAPKQRAKVPLVAASVSRRPANSMPAPKAVVEAPVNSRLGALKAVAKPVGGPASSKQRSSKTVTQLLAGPSASRPKSATKPVATPAAKTHKRVRSEDIDELSLGVDEFILLSSRPRTNPLPLPQIGIKHEELVDSPVLLSVPAARKRKLDVMRDNGFDELSVLGEQPAPIASASQLGIKTETDEPSLPLSQPTMPKRRGRPSRVKDVAESSSQARSSRAPEIMHAATSTPLLDLTPVRNVRANAERMKEIGDSEEEDDTESPSHRPRQRPRGQTARPVDFSNSTPITKGRWNRDSLKAEQVSVLVKTPGGTMRRCGVDGFECRRSFCFRCDSNGLGQAA